MADYFDSDEFRELLMQIRYVRPSSVNATVDMVIRDIRLHAELVYMIECDG